MIIEWRRYDKKNAAELGITLTSKPCVFTLSAKPLEMRGLMSCGHAVECMNLFSYVYHKILHDQYEFRCPAPLSDDPADKCNKKWNYDEIRRMCLLSSTDRDFFEMALNQNRIFAEGDVKPCPQCQRYVLKFEGSTWALCQPCNLKDPANSFYCFECNTKMKERKRKPSVKELASIPCDSGVCRIGDNLLFDIPKKQICGEEVESIQRCPKCKIWIEHVGPKYCKIMTCVCKFRFCFICNKGGNLNTFQTCEADGGTCDPKVRIVEAIPTPILTTRFTRPEIARVIGQDTVAPQEAGFLSRRMNSSLDIDAKRDLESDFSLQSPGPLFHIKSLRPKKESQSSKPNN